MGKYLRALLAALVATPLGGCAGLTVPEVQEFWGTPIDTTNKIANITFQVECELGKAVRDEIGTDNDAADINKGRKIKFFENWIADLLLILVVDEKGNASPSVSVIKTLSTMQSKAVGFNANLSSEATRTEKIHVFFKLGDFIHQKKFSNDCKLARPAEATLFVESDLKIEEWISFSLLNQYLGYGAPYSQIANKTLAAAFTHDIKFEIVSAGGITPTWKLVEFGSSAYGMGSAIGSSRDRTQELILTLGPPDDTPGNKGGVNPVARTSQTTAEQGAENSKSRAVISP